MCVHEHAWAHLCFFTTKSALLIRLVLGTFGAEQVGGKKVCLPEMDNASANKEHKSQTSLVPGGSSTEAPPRGLRLVQVRTLAGADLKG